MTAATKLGCYEVIEQIDATGILVPKGKRCHQEAPLRAQGIGIASVPKTLGRFWWGRTPLRPIRPKILAFEAPLFLTHLQNQLPQILPPIQFL